MLGLFVFWVVCKSGCGFFSLCFSLDFLRVSGKLSPLFLIFFFLLVTVWDFFCARLSHLVMTSLTRWRHVTPTNEWLFLWERNPICFGETVIQPNANDEDFIKKRKERKTERKKVKQVQFGEKKLWSCVNIHKAVQRRLGVTQYGVVIELSQRVVIPGRVSSVLVILYKSVLFHFLFLPHHRSCYSHVRKPPRAPESECLQCAEAAWLSMTTP